MWPHSAWYLDKLYNADEYIRPVIIHELERLDLVERTEILPELGRHLTV
jgi:hypothetical protein